jgi:hypothetical protein
LVFAIEKCTKKITHASEATATMNMMAAPAHGGPLCRRCGHPEPDLQLLGCSCLLHAVSVGHGGLQQVVRFVVCPSVNRIVFPFSSCFVAEVGATLRLRQMTGTEWLAMIGYRVCFCIGVTGGSALKL